MNSVSQDRTPTRKEALRRTREGIRAYPDSLKRHGEPLPVGPDLIIEKVEDLKRLKIIK